MRSLERQLEGRTDELREHRRIIAALTSRIPEIEAPPRQDVPPSEAQEPPQEPPGSPETGAEGGARGEATRRAAAGPFSTG